MNLLPPLTPEQRLIESYADVSTRRLQELQGAIDAVIHRRSGGMPARPTSLNYFTHPANGERACIIPTFPNYAVTETGKVYSYVSAFFLRTHKDKKNGCTVIIRSDGVKRGVSIHRLVATFFLVKPVDCNSVEHEDGDKLNNHVLNLRWVKRAVTQAKRGIRGDNKTGYRGVTLHASGNFAVSLQGSYVGCYATAEEAALAYNRRAEEVGFFFRNSIIV